MRQVAAGGSICGYSKAFDSVSHNHNSWVLKAGGMDQHIMNLKEESYQKITMRVQVFSGSTLPISIKAGVKQGDPMFPHVVQQCNGSLDSQAQDSWAGSESRE